MTRWYTACTQPAPHTLTDHLCLAQTSPAVPADLIWRDGALIEDFDAAVERMLDYEWSAWQDFAAQRSVPLAADPEWRVVNREGMARLLRAAVGEG